MKLAVLGFAHAHIGAYLEVWKARPELDIQVAACWDHDAARLADSASKHGIEAVPDLDAILARDDIEGVFVSAETSWHAPLVEAAAKAGKAIGIQKPIAVNMEQADRIVAAVEKYNVPFTIAWQMRTDPQNNAMKELLASGRLGKVCQVRRRHGLPTHKWGEWFENCWHVQPELNRDIFADDCSHPADFIHWLLGMPETVTAEITTVLNPKIKNDNGIVIFRYPGDGPLVEVDCSFTCTAAQSTTEIVCENGTILQDFGDVPGTKAPRPADNKGLRWYDASDDQWHWSDIPSPAIHYERLKGLAEPLAEFFHGRRPAICGAREGRDSLRMVLACYVSNAEGRRVSIGDPAIQNV